MNIVIGTPIYRKGAYVLDKFMANQEQIQQCYSSAGLILATCENDYFRELECLLTFWKLRGRVILYDVVKPDYARSNIWNIACGREAIRKYTLSQTEAKYLLFLDADMTFEPSVISTMEEQILGYDVIFSGCPLHNYGTGLSGTGCVMLRRCVLERVKFRCYEFRNGEVMFEDNLLEMDLFQLGCRIKKGFFLSVSHYKDATEASSITPKSVGIVRKTANSAFLRYVLLRMSFIFHRNIPWRLKKILYKCHLR